MFKDAPTISDAVAIYQTIDPCMACTERVVILDENNNREEFRSLFDVSRRMKGAKSNHK
jgi:energy-converting hydrogenase A subunit O